MSERILGEIVNERDLQDRQWGGPEHDDQHGMMDWLNYIQKQSNQATALLCHQEPGGPEQYRERMVKIAALAVAAIESYDRKLK